MSGPVSADLNFVMIAAIFLTTLGAYLGFGLLFSLPFVLWGAKKIDPPAGQSSWGFRLVIIPGVSVFWPVLLQRWLGGSHEPPGERNPHRLSHPRTSNRL
jgi:hypothetical protein